MRERYEDWLDDRLGVLRHKRERDRDMPAAEAKRERKAAKRRRDAALTRMGTEARLSSASSIDAWRAELERRDGAASWPVGARIVHRYDRGTTGVVRANDATHVMIEAHDPELGRGEVAAMHWIAAREWRLA